jgi:endonuclease/exonuclease/phosphatase family metal-dependent hydrolase
MYKLPLLFVVLVLAFATQSQTPHKEASHSTISDAHLLEIGQAAKVRAIPNLSDEIKVVSYNIRWRGGEDLRKLAHLLKHDPEIGGASILGLQEVDRNRTRTGNANTAKLLADELGMHYAWAAPPTAKAGQEEETGVLLLSPYPMTAVHRIVLPHAGPNKRRRAGIGATLKIGASSLRVYSVHSENRMSTDKKLDQMKAVLKDLAGYPRDMPAIVMGDLNTWEPGAGDKTAKLFTSEGFHTPFDGDATFSQRVLMVPIKFRLDWIWLRNIEATKSGINKKISLSDHWPLWVALRIKTVRA